MSIISATYFQKGYLFIPHNKDINLDTSSSTENKDLEFFIEKYERELLVNALGIELYTEFDELPTPYSEKWAALIDGETYTVDDKQYRWEGLKGREEHSLIANYVYCMWIRNDESLYTTTGIVQNKAKNAESFSPTPKYIKAWNDFISMYQEGHKSHPIYIREFYGDVEIGCQENVFKSLCQYITDKNNEDPTAFPDAPLLQYENQNSLGI